MKLNIYYVEQGLLLLNITEIRPYPFVVIFLFIFKKKKKKKKAQSFGH